MADQRLPTRPEKTIVDDDDLVYIVRPSDITADPTGTGFYIKRSNLKTNLEDLGIKHVTTITEFNALVSGATPGKWLISTDISMTASQTLPSDVTLAFNKASINLNGFTLTGVNTRIEAPLTQIFSNGDLTGDWDIDGFYFEWFGAKGDDSTSDSTAIEKSLNYGGSLVKGVKDKIYLLDAQIAIPTAVDVEIDLQGSTLKRKSTYTTAEPVFNAVSTSSKSVIVKNGFIDDVSGVVSDPFFEIDTRLNVTLDNLKCTSEGLIYEIFTTDDVKIINNTLENIIATPLFGSRLGDINNSTTVLVQGNTLKNTYTGFAVHAITTGFINDVKILNNSLIKTQNTGIFCRMLGTGSNAAKSCLIDGNYLEDIGKSAIKYTAPSTAVSGEIRNGIITNNHIKGFGLTVSSPAIAVFRDIADTLISIENITISNNIVDGFDSSGTVTTIIGIGQRGIVCSYVDLLTLNGNIVRNCLSDGIKIDNASYIASSGNIVENCCLDAVGTAGVYLINVFDSKLDFVSIGNQNTSDGIFISQCRRNRVIGVYNSNTNYGLYEDSSGTEGTTKSGLNVYNVTVISNTTGDLYMRGDVLLDSSREMNCYDSTGDRHYGTSARRDLLSTNDWGARRNVGFKYWNTDNDDIEVRRNSDWKKYDGSAVTT